MLIERQHNRSTTHGYPCHHARSCVRRTGDHASRHSHGMTVLLDLPAVRDFCLRCTVVQPYYTAVSSAGFLCFSFFDTWGFLRPLIFLEMALEVSFLSKPKDFA